VDAGVKAQYQSQIQGLLYVLNDKNDTFAFAFRAIYTAYQHSPCTRAAYFERELAKVRRRESVLEEQSRKLEVMRTADFAAIVRSRNKRKTKST
jgi:hypothetical protein